MLLAIFLVCSASALVRNYTSSQPLSADVTLYWTLNGTALQFGLQGPSRGWLAVGFTPSSTNAMVGNGQGSDLIVGYVTTSGPCAQGCIGSYSASTYPSDTGTPPRDPDSQQSPILVAGRIIEPSGIMELEFDRLLNTGFPGDVIINPNVATIVLYAYNPSATAVTSNTVFEKHLPTTRGVNSVLFSSVGPQPLNSLSSSGTTTSSSAQGSIQSPDGVIRIDWTSSLAQGTIAFTVTLASGADTWGAVGFSSQASMIGADVVVGWVSPQGVVTVTDRYATAHDTPALDTSQDVTSVSGSRTATTTVFKFTRLAKTSDTTQDADLSVGSINVLWAYGPVNSYTNAQFSQHIGKGIVSDVSLMTDCIDYGRSTSTASTLATYIPIHGVLMTLAWGALGPIATVAAACNSAAFPVWFPAHWVIHTISLASSVAGFVLVFYAKSGVVTIGAHQIMGIVVFGLSFLQAALGIVSHCMYDSTRGSPPVFPDIIHHFAGRIIHLAAIATLFLGVWTLQTLYGLPSVLPYVLLAVLVAAPIILYLVARFTVFSTGSIGSSSAFYNMDTVDRSDYSKSNRPPSYAGRIIFVVALIFGLLAFGGFVVTIYVPSYSYSGTQSASSTALARDSKGCFTMQKFNLPSSTTSYMCRGFFFPDNPSQLAVLFEPSVDNAQVVHHMILYRTPALTSSTPYSCPSMPAGSTPMWAWAVGGTPLVAPPVTGFLASSNLALQVHYDNPTGSSTQVDSSGVKVSFTPTPRQYTSFLLQVGVQTRAILLQPRSITHISYSCPVNQIPTGASIYANVWTAGLHGHTRLRKIWLEQFRGSTRVSVIACDSFYSFQKQQFVSLNNTRVIRGDVLKIHCQFDTTADTTVITGGESTSNEMCLSFLGFYAVGFTVSQDVTCYGAPVTETPVLATADVCV